MGREEESTLLPSDISPLTDDATLQHFAPPDVEQQLLMVEMAITMSPPTPEGTTGWGYIENV